MEREIRHRAQIQIIIPSPFSESVRTSEAKDRYSTLFSNALSSVADRRIPCYFISPHLDDAILSAGGLLSYLSDKTSVNVVTLFTEGSSLPYTHFAKQWLRRCGYSNDEEFFADRRNEDRNACDSLGIKSTHLGFIDGAWRKRNLKGPLKKIGNFIPEVGHLYPLVTKTGSLAKEDQELLTTIKHRLTDIVGNNQSLVFCPLALSRRHIDHQLTRDVCKDVFQDVIFWADFPSSRTYSERHLFIRKVGLESSVWEGDLSKKREAILHYRSQLNALFPSGYVSLPKEQFYFNEKSLNNLLSH